MTEPEPMVEFGRGATTFLVAAIEKPLQSLRQVLANEDKLKAAAEYHHIPVEWARFWIETEIHSRLR